MALKVEGFVEVDASLFKPGVLEGAFDTFLHQHGGGMVTYGKASERLGTVTKISGRGDKIIVGATLETPPARTALKDTYNKIAAGSIKGLAIDGIISADHATITSVVIAAITPVVGTGQITAIGPSS